MSEFARLMPSAPVPPLRVGTVGGPCWRLCDQKPKHFTLVLFHRGLGSASCEALLKAFEDRIADFRKRGVRVIAVSADSRARAEAAAEAWGIDELTICWGLTIDQARDWGLYVTEERGAPDTPPFRVEPALFLVRPDNTLYGSVVQTCPLTPLRVDDILAGLDRIIAAGESPCGAWCGGTTSAHAAE